MLILIYLLITIVFIVLSTAKYKVHPFLTLLIASLGMGVLSGLDVNFVVKTVSEGFGNTLKSIGIIIACGSIIGTFLEKTGAAKSIANKVLQVVGNKNSALAMNLTGSIVSIPVFCDSGFVILSTLNNAINKKTGISLSVLGTSLAAGLYATHVFVPPTPGPLAAASIIGADVGLVLIFGLLIAIPVSIVGWLWASYYCSRFSINQKIDNDDLNIETKSHTNLTMSVLPIIIPIVLITLKSIINHPTIELENLFINNVISFCGHPIIAILFGVFIAMFSATNFSLEQHFDWVSSALKSAGVIILITGAGGAFGNILRATSIGDTISQSLLTFEVGLLLPFIIAAFLKTAQGSSTVSIITTSAMVLPLLDSLGLSSEMGKVLTVLSIGAGAMTVSHLNDSYFWIVSQFSNMNTKTALHCHTASTLLQGLTSIVLIKIISLFLLV
ncbi:GntP family permease [Candidatus Marinimicrobia bacterium]|nr:GntP family permease [Candidatus Neomarinimicrobiota bacterium]